MSYQLQIDVLENRSLPSFTLPTDPFLFTPIAEQTPLAVHTHADLQVIIDGQVQPIPADVGVQIGSALPLHTHDATGKVHVESSVLRTFYLLDFLAVWNTTPQGQAVIDRLQSASALMVTVNSTHSIDPTPIVLPDNAQIVIRAISNNPDPVTAANQHLVAGLYRDLLQREPDLPGLIFSTTALDLGTPRMSLIQGIQNSAEHQALVVQDLYQTLLHRSADPAGLAHFTAFPASGGTAEQIEISILASTEFFQASGGTSQGYLASLYSDVLHRAIDPVGQAGWSSLLEGGASRDQVAIRVVRSREAANLLIEGLYQDFLHRSADALGQSHFFDAWLSGMSEEQILAAILASDEYLARQQA